MKNKILTHIYYYTQKMIWLVSNWKAIIENCFRFDNQGFVCVRYCIQCKAHLCVLVLYIYERYLILVIFRHCKILTRRCRFCTGIRSKLRTAINSSNRMSDKGIISQFIIYPLTWYAIAFQRWYILYMCNIHRLTAYRSKTNRMRNKNVFMFNAHIHELNNWNRANIQLRNFSFPHLIPVSYLIFQ